MDLVNTGPQMLTYGKEVEIGIKFGGYKAKILKEGGEIRVCVENSRFIRSKNILSCMNKK